VCGYSYDSPLKLKLHLARHNPSELLIDCIRCGDKFRFMDKRKQVRSTDDENPFARLKNFMPPPMPIRVFDGKIKGG